MCVFRAAARGGSRRRRAGPVSHADPGSGGGRGPAMADMPWHAAGLAWEPAVAREIGAGGLPEAPGEAGMGPALGPCPPRGCALGPAGGARWPLAGLPQASAHQGSDTAPGPTLPAGGKPGGRGGGEGGKADRMGVWPLWVSVPGVPGVPEQVWLCRASEGWLSTTASGPQARLLCPCPGLLSPGPLSPGLLSPGPAGDDRPPSLPKHFLRLPYTWV